MMLNASICKNLMINNQGTRKKTKIVDSIKLKVLAKMKDVTVKIENDIREIAAMEVSY